MALNPGRVFGNGRRASRPRIRPSASMPCGSNAVPAITPRPWAIRWSIRPPWWPRICPQIVKDHSHELLGFDEAQQLLNGARQERAEAGRGPGAEGAVAVGLRPCAADPARRTRAAAQPAWHRRSAGGSGPAQSGTRRPRRRCNGLRLSRQIVQEINGLEPELPVLTLAPALERVLQESLQGGSAVLEPGLAERDAPVAVGPGTSPGAERSARSGCWCRAGLRPWLAKFTRPVAAGPACAGLQRKYRKPSRSA